MLGDWQYSSGSADYDPLIESPPPMKDFKLFIKKDGTFKLPTEKFEISGEWIMRNDTLVLIGSPAGKNLKIEFAFITPVNDSTLTVKLKDDGFKSQVLTIKRIN
ncbi:MAG: hypothetical protein AAF487_13835 [Bacteroidota bacterium]